MEWLKRKHSQEEKFSTLAIINMSFTLKELIFTKLFLESFLIQFCAWQKQFNLQELNFANWGAQPPAPLFCGLYSMQKLIGMDDCKKVPTFTAFYELFLSDVNVKILLNSWHLLVVFWMCPFATLSDSYP